MKQTRKSSGKKSQDERAAFAAHRAGAFSLSPCAALYNAVLNEPWLVPPGQACVPDLLVLPTIKQKHTVRGQLGIGTGGYGWVIVAPAGPKDTLYACGYTLGAAYLKTMADAISTGDAGTDVLPFTISPTYTFGVTNSAAEYRLVGMGVRVMYIGTTLNESGVYYCFEQAGNDTITGATGTQVMNDARTRMIRMGSDKATAVWWPQRRVETDFSVLDYYNSLAAGTITYPIGVLIDGAVAGSKFEFEITYHYEISQPVSNLSTPSHSDTTGMGLALSARAQGQANKKVPSITDSLKTIAREAMHGVSGFVGSAIGAMAGPLGSRVGARIGLALGDRFAGGSSTAIVPYGHGINQD